MQRRHVLRWLSLAAVGALLGAGTTALLSDTETSASQSFADGTLDLVLGGSAQDDAINLIHVKPGDSGSRILSLSNAGTIAGKVSLRAVEVSDTENTCTEPELADEPDCDAAVVDSGELDSNVEVTLTSGSDTWTGTLDTISGVLRSLTGTLNGGAIRNLTIDWVLPGPTTGNDVQSDGTSFHIAATLDQAVGNSFEGSLDGWTPNPPESSAVVTSGAGQNPVEGDYFALLTAGPANTYVTLSKSFTLSAGQTLSGWAFFKANDYLPFDDDGAVVVSSAGGDSTLFSASVASVGDYGTTVWEDFSYSALTAGTYTLTAKVRNVSDGGLPSQVGLDGVNVS